MGPPPAQGDGEGSSELCAWISQGQPLMAAPMQQRPQGPAGYGGDQGGSLQPPQQQMMGNPGQRATLSHMLRMTGELRAERGVQPSQSCSRHGSATGVASANDNIESCSEFHKCLCGAP